MKKVIQGIDQSLARAILGDNFLFGPEEWSMFHQINFSKRQLRAVARFPWGEEILNAPCPFNEGKAVRETHVAFLGLNRFLGKRLSIRQWQKIYPATSQPRFSSYDSWYTYERFARRRTCGFRWYLMLKYIIPGSGGEDVYGRVRSLPAQYERPFAVEEVTKHLLYYRKNGTYPGYTYGRTRDYIFHGQYFGDFSWSARAILVGGSRGIDLSFMETDMNSFYSGLTQKIGATASLLLPPK